MNDTRRKVAALVNAKEAMALDDLIDLIIDTVARGLGRMGGRPKLAPKAVDESTLSLEIHEEKPVTESSEPVCVSAQPVSREGGKGGDPSSVSLVLFSDQTGSTLQPSGKDRECDEPAPAAFRDVFWAMWPRKDGKAPAIRAWKRHKPPVEKVREALTWMLISDRWRKGYIPKPATWINEHRWNDDPASYRDNFGAPPPAVDKKTERVMGTMQRFADRHNGGAK